MLQQGEFNDGYLVTLNLDYSKVTRKSRLCIINILDMLISTCDSTVISSKIKVIIGFFKQVGGAATLLTFKQECYRR